MEITQCQKGFEIWLAMATRNLRECASGDVRLKTGGGPESIRFVARSRISPLSTNNKQRQADRYDIFANRDHWVIDA